MQFSCTIIIVTRFALSKSLTQFRRVYPLQNNQDPWLHLSRPEDIQEFTNQEHLLKAFLKTYESLDDRLSVTVTIKSTDGRSIPFVGSLNFNGVTVATFDASSGDRISDTRTISIGIVDSNIYFSQIFDDARSCIEYFATRLNTTNSVIDYCNTSINLLKTVANMSDGGDDLSMGLDLSVLKQDASVFSVTAYIEFKSDNADGQFMDQPDVSIIQRYIHPYQSNIEVDDHGTTVPAIQVIVHRNPDKLTDIQQQIVNRIRQFAADADKQRTADEHESNEFANEHTFYANSLTNIHVTAALTRTLDAETEHYADITDDIPEDWQDLHFGGDTHFIRMYEQPLSLSMSKEADVTSDPIVTISTDQHKLVPNHFSQFATLRGTDKFDQAPVAFRQMMQQFPAALAGSAAIDIILDRLGAVKYRIEHSSDNEMNQLTLIPKIEYDPINSPANYKVVGMITYRRNSADDYDALTSEDILGELCLQHNIQNDEADVSASTADELKDMFSSLKISDGQHQLSAYQINMLLQLFTSIADELQSLSIVDLPKSDDVFNNEHIQMSDIDSQSPEDIIEQLRRENRGDDSDDNHHDGDDQLE